MSHFPEEELIAYHLGESTHAAAVEKHLEVCEACSQTSESISETLRVFSADRVPHADFETSWQRVRSTLPVLPTAEKRSWKKLLLFPAIGALIAAMLVAVFFVRIHHEEIRQTASYKGNEAPGAPHEKTKEKHYAFNRPGPLTLEPADEVSHLDDAERLLTAVNHTSGTLDDPTRATAHQLLLRNADFVQRAQQRGDLAEASTLEDLGRVLTNIEHEPHSRRSGIDLRLEMNTDGLLLDIRILRQNDQSQ